jgi:hypothetical protein
VKDKKDKKKDKKDKKKKDDKDASIDSREETKAQTLISPEKIEDEK